MDALGHGEFARLYIGVGRPERGDAVVEHVLGAPGGDEAEAHANAIARAAEILIELTRTAPEELVSRLKRQ